MVLGSNPVGTLNTSHKPLCQGKGVEKTLISPLMKHANQLQILLLADRPWRSNQIIPRSLGWTGQTRGFPVVSPTTCSVILHRANLLSRTFVVFVTRLIFSILANFGWSAIYWYFLRKQIKMQEVLLNQGFFMLNTASVTKVYLSI